MPDVGLIRADIIVVYESMGNMQFHFGEKGLEEIVVTTGDVY